ncbi:aminotransferase class V-fold PLP-dependent enzyme [Paraburkholderia panacisoli]|uniref:Aminotransferase class V-fold PLP-dependent enzyme n=1 Tax=Paraburkholderia panacisoli TaxID=2603818 RepID=A0A5B0G2M1_9BURK|nr:aminotransferase class V-fold PLP-dependent enzyme [Paraburkholderia panacisoli]KAA0997747.1 aminotransferase class V-fold PLP-dependent enzyme [Paraburkholderia panacisoli]
MNVGTTSSSDLSGEQFWEKVRAAYPTQQPLMNLNNAAVSPPPVVVEQATIDAYRLVSRNPDVNMWSKLDAALPSIKQQLAALADCSPDEIALNRNSSEGLSTVIFGLPLSAGDQVLISEWDYPSARAAWIQRQQREHITVASVDFDVMGSDDEIVRAYEEAITSSTRVILLTHMLHWTGRLMPVKRICKLAREREIITIVDGAQTFAQMPVSFRDLDCDFFITSLHKWLCAPVGNGMLIVRESRIGETWPLLAPFDPAPLRIDKFDHWNLGTYNSALQAGIAPALKFHQEIGPAKIHARLKELSRYWIELARDIPGFTLHTPLNADLGAVSLFSIDDVDSRKIEQELRQRYQIHVKYRQVRHIEGLRVSPHIYMLKSDMDAFVSALAQVVQMSGG